MRDLLNLAFPTTKSQSLSATKQENETQTKKNHLKAIIAFPVTHHHRSTHQHSHYLKSHPKRKEKAHPGQNPPNKPTPAIGPAITGGSTIAPPTMMPAHAANTPRQLAHCCPAQGRLTTTSPHSKTEESDGLLSSLALERNGKRRKGSWSSLFEKRKKKKCQLACSFILVSSSDDTPQLSEKSF